MEKTVKTGSMADLVVPSSPPRLGSWSLVVAAVDV
jgi:hypothetical protein